MAQSRVPVYPDRALIDSFARHKECVIVQPTDVVLAKHVESATVSLIPVREKSACSFVKQILFEVDYATVLDMLLREVRCIG